MTHAHAHPHAFTQPTVLSVRGLANGVAGGLVGGVLFGILMQMMGMIPMVAMLVGSTSSAVGWVVHLAISAFIGATFSVLFGKLSTGWLPAIGLGVGYGIVWWVLGALILMPARLGMGIFEISTAALQSLMGHVIFGLALGVVFEALTRAGHKE